MTKAGFGHLAAGLPVRQGWKAEVGSMAGLGDAALSPLLADLSD